MLTTYSLNKYSRKKSVVLAYIILISKSFTKFSLVWYKDKSMGHSVKIEFSSNTLLANFRKYVYPYQKLLFYSVSTLEKAAKILKKRIFQFLSKIFMLIQI